MKKIIAFALLLIVSSESFSQQTNSLPALTKQDYLKKSRTQNTTAWFIISGGLVLGTISYGISYKEGRTNTAEILEYTSLATMLGSIPLFIAARKNKKKAMSLSFKNETMPQLQKGSFVNQPVPSITLKISL